MTKKTRRTSGLRNRKGAGHTKATSSSQDIAIPTTNTYSHANAQHTAEKGPTLNLWKWHLLLAWKQWVWWGHNLSNSCFQPLFASSETCARQRQLTWWGFVMKKPACRVLGAVCLFLKRIKSCPVLKSNIAHVRDCSAMCFTCYEQTDFFCCFLAFFHTQRTHAEDNKDNTVDVWKIDFFWLFPAHLTWANVNAHIVRQFGIPPPIPYSLFPCSILLLVLSFVRLSSCCCLRVQHRHPNNRKNPLHKHP